MNPIKIMYAQQDFSALLDEKIDKLIKEQTIISMII